MLSQPSIRVLVDAEAFQRALSRPWLSKTAHFALHHLSPAESAMAVGHLRASGAAEPVLSPDQTDILDQPVDNSLENPVDKCVDGTLEMAWAGYVLPKRHARRAVTRNLLRRQMRQVLRDQQRAPAGLPAGVWVLRLRQGFDGREFPSAASEPLRRLARSELQTLVGRAVDRLRPGAA